MRFRSRQKFLYVVTVVPELDSDAVRVEKAIHNPDFPRAHRRPSLHRITVRSGRTKVKLPILATVSQCNDI